MPHPIPPPGPELVISFAEGYDHEALRPFVSTLRNHYQGAVVVFTNRIAKDTLEFLARNRITTIPYRWYRVRLSPHKCLSPANTRWHYLHKNYSGWIDRLLADEQARLRLKCLLGKHFIHINGRRFLEMYSLWEKLPVNNDGRVLVCDIRDIVFQANPFEESSDDLSSFLEDGFATIGESWANNLWIEMVYGKEAAAGVAHHPISCAGILLGKARAVRQYLKCMAEGLTRKGMNLANLHGIDQGIHNWIIAKKMVPGMRVHPNGGGTALNMHQMDLSRLNWNNENQLVNGAGKVIPIIHQYDRHPDIAAKLFRSLNIDSDARDQK